MNATAQPDPATRSRWEQEWQRVWDAALHHAALDTDRAAFERLRGTADGSAERAELLDQLVGPTWRDDHGDDVFTDASYQEWSERGYENHRSSLPQRFEDHPERRDLDALVPAWRAGLMKFVVIPCQGDHSRRITRNALLTTEQTRADSAAYRRALAAFG